VFKELTVSVTKFLITEFLITNFLITRFLIDKVLDSLSTKFLK
jgi:hypothetical protein